MNKTKILSIVVPVYQNQASLPETVSCLLSLEDELASLGLALEIVCVDDGSYDGSRELLRELGMRIGPKLRVVFLTRNFGQTPAIQAGLRNCRGDAAAIISCDLQDPYRKIVEMAACWLKGARFVIGVRETRAEGRLHQTVSGLYWKMIRLLAIPDFPSTGYDFCLLDRSVIDEVNRINEKNSSIFVLIYWLGFKPTKLGIHRSLRSQGRSAWGLGRKIRFTIDTLIGFTYLPSRIITFASFVLALAGLAYLCAATYHWFLHRESPPGWMTVVGLLTVLGSGIFFALGIISEYLMRILDEARKRPPFVVEQILDTSDGNRAAKGTTSDPS